MCVIRLMPGRTEGLSASPARIERSETEPTAASAVGLLALDWLESQARVAGIWIDRLVADGDPGGLVATLEEQRVWLEVQLDRLRRGGPDGAG